ncbi:MAG: NAD-dependent epimerase/dehydratase family protein [Fimbriimonadaceae bacterium]|nr:NAD-dependent epimerase/dehydratase family protein [Fimbriimonadaceae bacterium]
MRSGSTEEIRTLKSEHIVVLGSGVLGTEIASQLHRQGRRVTMVVRTPRSGPAKGVPTVVSDIYDQADLRAKLSSASTVFHSAAPPYHRWPEEFPALQSSIVGAAIANNCKLVVAENVYGYGRAGRLTEELPLNAQGRKGRVRAQLSEELIKLHAAGALPVVIGRSSDFVGPGVFASALGERFWPPLIAGKAIGWYGNPELKHSYTYVPDFARALISLADSEDAYGQAWHVPCMELKSTREVIELAVERLGTPLPKVARLADWQLKLAGLFQPAARELIELKALFTEELIVEDSKFRARFDGEATSWDDAISATIEYWKARKND